jgi:Flp pilus assembly protein TadG
MQPEYCRKRTTDRGSNLVELALVLPLLLLLLAGVLDLGRIYHTYVVMLNASREGARYAAEYPSNVANIIRVVQNEAAFSDVTIPTDAITIQPVGANPGNPIRVTLDLRLEPLIMSNVLGLPAVPMRASTAFRVRER